MRGLSVYRLVVALAAAAALAPSVASAAAPAWGPRESVPNIGNVLRVEPDPTGHIVVSTDEPLFRGIPKFLLRNPGPNQFWSQYNAAVAVAADGTRAVANPAFGSLTDLVAHRETPDGTIIGAVARITAPHTLRGLRVAADGAGNMLVAFSTVVAGGQALEVSFIPAGAGAGTTPVTIATDPSAIDAVGVALDPGGTGVMVWTSSTGGTQQSTTLKASLGAWTAPATVGSFPGSNGAALVRTAPLPDGRLSIVLTVAYPQSANPALTQQQLAIARRVPGQPFGQPTFIAPYGTGANTYQTVSSVAVNLRGDLVVSWWEQNGAISGDNCHTIRPKEHARDALFAAAGGAPIVRTFEAATDFIASGVGPDGRRLAAWDTPNDPPANCFNSNGAVYNSLFQDGKGLSHGDPLWTPTGANTTTTVNPLAIGFLPNGDAYFLTQIDGAGAALPYVSGVPVVKAPPPVVPKPTLGKPKVNKKTGGLSLALRANVAGTVKFRLLAKKSLLRAAAAPVTLSTLRGSLKAGVSKTFKLKPGSKGTKALKKHHKLKVTIELTFTPTGGGKAVVVKKAATLQLT